MRRDWLFFLFLFTACSNQLCSQTVPVSVEAPTGLPSPVAMAAGEGEKLYLAFNDTDNARLPPVGVVDLTPKDTYQRTVIARVRPEGDVVFWAIRVPMSLVDLKVDAQGNLWAAGLARRTRGDAVVAPCYSTEHPASDNLAYSLAVAKIAPDGKTAPVFQCVGYGWQVYSGSVFKAQINFDSAGAIYLSGTSSDGAGFTATPGAAIEKPASTAAYTSSAFAIKLDPAASVVRYATWLPGNSLNSASVDASGGLIFGGSVTESSPLPSAPAASHHGATLLRTEDAGATWQAATEGLPATAQFAIARRNPNALVAWTQTSLWLTSDGGRSWTAAPLPSAVTNLDYRASIVIDDSGQTVYVYPASGASLYRRAKGAWTTLKPPTASFGYLPTLAAGDGTTLYVLYPDAVWYSADAGDSFQQTAASTSAGNYINAAVHPADGRILYRFVSSDSGRMYQQSTDHGHSWSASTVVNASALSVSPVSTNVLAAFSEYGGGSYVSTDAGQHWQKFATSGCGLPNPLDPTTLICFGQTRIEKLDLATGIRSIMFPSLGTTTVGGFLWPATSATQFYVTRGPRTDAFLCRLSPAGDRIAPCALNGGVGDEAVTHIVPAAAGGYWVAGTTNSRDFVASPGALQRQVGSLESGRLSSGDTLDIFLCRYTAELQQGACTPFGGSVDEKPIAVWEDGAGNPVVLGNSSSWDFPATADGQRSPSTQPPSPDAYFATFYGFVLRANATLSNAEFASVFRRSSTIQAAAAISPAAVGFASSMLVDNPYGVTSGASVGVLDWSGALATDIAASNLREPAIGSTLAVTAGSIAILSGSGLADGPAKAGTDALPVTLAGAQVLFDGSPAPLLSAAADEIRFQVPWNATAGGHTVKVVHGASATPEAASSIFAAAPRQFRDAGTLRPVAVNEDGSVHDADHPARPGTLLSIYFSGGGPVASPPPPGRAADGESQTLTGARVLIGPYEAVPEYAGVAPGILGSWVVRFRVPSIPAGEYSLWIAMDKAQSNRTLISVGEAQ